MKPSLPLSHKPLVKPPLFTSLLAGCLLAISLMATATSALAQPRTFVIDPDHFSVGFMVDHVGYNDVLGMFLKGEGKFVYDEENRQLSSGKVIVRADSVFSNHKKRDQHLRSDDFLDADNHNDIVFEVTDLNVDSAGKDNSGQVTGNLTLLGKTRPVTLDITLNKTGRYPFGHKEYVLGASARASLKRSDWGMTYGLEGDLVGDQVDLILEFEAIRQ